MNVCLRGLYHHSVSSWAGSYVIVTPPLSFCFHSDGFWFGSILFLLTGITWTLLEDEWSITWAISRLKWYCLLQELINKGSFSKNHLRNVYWRYLSSETGSLKRDHNLITRAKFSLYRLSICCHSVSLAPVSIGMPGSYSRVKSKLPGLVPGIPGSSRTVWGLTHVWQNIHDLHCIVSF